MDLNIEINGSKILVSWNNKRADFYRIFFKKDGKFYETAKIYDNTFIRFSLVPYGENECFVQAVKNGRVIDESSVHKFKFDKIDLVYSFDKNNLLNLYYSFHSQAQGYRLYLNENSNGFNGCKNSQNCFMTAELKEDTEYKIKPFTTGEDGNRNFLASSLPIEPKNNRFEAVSIYKSYNYNMFLSWNFNGDADGFLVYAENVEKPIFETNNALCHNVMLSDYKATTKFVVKAFINTVEGRVIISETDLISIGIRKYKKPEISLIIPAYNAQDYITRSIDSALASDFDNLEIIIVNDGSTDDTQKIIDWYNKNYSNVVSIVKENGGVADARNKGIEVAKGDYIAFMDNDDLIRPDMMTKLFNSITKNSCDVAIAPLYRITAGGYTTHCNLPFMPDIPLDIDKYFEIMYTPGYYNCAIWNKLYRASIVKEHPLGILKYEDVSWTPCILSYMEKFCFINSPMYEWDRKTRPETFGDVLARQSEEDLYEHRKQAMLFFVKNGNPKRLESLKTVAIRRLNRYAKNSKNSSYNELINKINSGKY